ncbi:MAG: hypothetical protein AAF492_16195 [Verrucomicrobiota bacterium]
MKNTFSFIVAALFAVGCGGPVENSSSREPGREVADVKEPTPAPVPQPPPEPIRPKTNETQPEPEPTPESVEVKKPKPIDVSRLKHDVIPGDPLTDPNARGKTSDKLEIIGPNHPMYKTEETEALAKKYNGLMDQDLTALLAQMKMPATLSTDEKIDRVEQKLGKVEASDAWKNSPHPPSARELETIRTIRRKWIESQVKAYRE